jgi:8-oxo-dGTP pyrophosphatase MutT (NUDIX family)
MNKPVNWPARLLTCLDSHEAPDRGQAARSDYDLNLDTPREAPLKEAAVLVPLIHREEGWQVLLTRRTQDMPTHAGQIAFPGGRVAQDETLYTAALREFEEETGISKSRTRTLGRFERYETASGFNITPFVATLDTPFTARPDPREVEAVFEVPFDFLMRVENYQRQSLEWQGRERYFYAVPWNEHFIWGATAGMLRALAQRVARQSKKEAPT